jgi:hypothetical protein
VNVAVCCNDVAVATTALTAAKRNLERASFFLDIHQGTQQGPGTPDNKRRELPRGALVFAIGALDAYLSEVAAEVMVAQFERGQATGDGRKVLEAIQRATPTLAIELAVAKPEVDRAAALRRAIVEHFYDQVSNHGAKAVSATVQRMGKSSSAVWDAVEAAGEASPQQRLDEWTDKRHAIIHRGQRPTVNREPARTCVKLVQTVSLEVDKVASEAKTEAVA